MNVTRHAIERYRERADAPAPRKKARETLARAFDHATRIGVVVNLSGRADLWRAPGFPVDFVVVGDAIVTVLGPDETARRWMHGVSR